MKRLFAMCTALACVLALAIPVLADARRTPDNDFFREHERACVPEERNYYINSRDGCADLQVSPVNQRAAAQARNGAEITVDYTYESGGVKWGMASYSVNGNKEDWLKWDKASGVGWVKMSDLLLLYDEQSFEEERAEEFTKYDGSFEKLCASVGQRVIVWSYPGSGAIRAELKTADPSRSPLRPSSMWMDANGRVWGKIDAYQGRSGWVCLSDPADGNLPVAEHSYQFYPAASGTDGARAPEKAAGTAQEGTDGRILAAAAVCGVMALLVSLRRRKSA